jgi:hypothetical protein
VHGCFLSQVKAGSIFDNIFLTDDFATAKKFAEDTWGKLQEAEKKMFDSVTEVGGRHVCRAALGSVLEVRCAFLWLKHCSMWHAATLGKMQCCL